MVSLKISGMAQPAVRAIRDRPRKSARRGIILDIAMKHFAERPYDDVSIDDICRDAGVAHGLVSYYFSGKRGLFSDAVDQAWKDMLQYERPREDELAGPDRVRGYVRRHFEYVERHAARFTGLMQDGNAAPPHIREIAQAARREARRELLHSLGCPADPSPRLRSAVEGWAGYLDNVTTDWLHHGDVERDEIAEQCVQALVALITVADGLPFDTEIQNAALTQVSAGASSLADTAPSPARSINSRIARRPARNSGQTDDSPPKTNGEAVATDSLQQVH